MWLIVSLLEKIDAMDLLAEFQIATLSFFWTSRQMRDISLKYSHDESKIGTSWLHLSISKVPSDRNNHGGQERTCTAALFLKPGLSRFHR